MSHDDDQADTPSSDDDQGPGPTADEIGEQVVSSYLAKTWGARSLNASQLEPNSLEQPESPPNTIYSSGLIKASVIVESLLPESEQVRQLPRAKFPLMY